MGTNRSKANDSGLNVRNFMQLRFTGRTQPQRGGQHQHGATPYVCNAKQLKPQRGESQGVFDS